MGHNEFRVGDVAVSCSESVVWAVIDRPDAMNAVNEAVLEGLAAAVETANTERAKVLIIRGSGGTFCTGADLPEAERLRDDHAALDEFSRRFGGILDEIEAGPFVSVAVVEGFAVAGGCELLLACDIVIADHRASIGDGHMAFGLVPAAGGSVRLCRTLSHARANFLLLTGALLAAEQAADWGLVALVAPGAELDTTVSQIVAEISSHSRTALTAVKSMIDTAGTSCAAQPDLHGRRAFLADMQPRDVREGLNVFPEK
ncbi:enoyl-CoA hydratase/isomerase family protein [Nocardia niigatensis]